MTIHNQEPKKPSIPEEWLTPRGTPQHEREQTQGMPLLVPQQRVWTGNGPPPRPPLSPTPPRKRSRRLALPSVIGLLLLIVAIAFGTMYGMHLFDGTPPGQSTPIGTAPGGSYVKQPLTPSQVNAIMHLVGHMQYKQLASMYVSRMSLDEELGQLIMVEYADTSYSPDLDMMVNKLHAGGVIMYEFQMQTFDQTKHDIAEMQKHAKIPLLISADEEGGPYVHRLLNIYPPRMSATAIYNTGDPNVATQQGHLAAKQLLALGINNNLAPDVDVQLVPGYDLVTRTFGNTPESVITYAGAYMKALQGDDVVACIKHYPGLGNALEDAHKTLPVINRTKDEIYSVELAPYKAFINSPDRLLNPGMIMPTDLLMPAIDPNLPAELSPIFMTDILRKQFGYDGVALTDALYMQGITERYSQYEAGVLALIAGNDMLLGPTGADQMIAMLDALKTALQNGRLSKARIDEAATRIVALKMEYHLMPAVPPQE